MNGKCQTSLPSLIGIIFLSLSLVQISFSAEQNEDIQQVNGQEDININQGLLALVENDEFENQNIEQPLVAVQFITPATLLEDFDSLVEKNPSQGQKMPPQNDENVSPLASFNNVVDNDENDNNQNNPGPAIKLTDFSSNIFGNKEFVGNSEQTFELNEQDEILAENLDENLPDFESPLPDGGSLFVVKKVAVNTLTDKKPQSATSVGRQKISTPGTTESVAIQKESKNLITEDNFTNELDETIPVTVQNPTLEEINFTTSATLMESAILIDTTGNNGISASLPNEMPEILQINQNIDKSDKTTTTKPFISWLQKGVNTVFIDQYSIPGWYLFTLFIAVIFVYSFSLWLIFYRYIPRYYHDPENASKYENFDGHELESGTGTNSVSLAQNSPPVEKDNRRRRSHSHGGIPNVVLTGYQNSGFV